MQLRHMFLARNASAKSGLFRPDGSLEPQAVRAAVPACLGCGYDLRGFSGLAPICPECGLKHDLPRMIARLSVGREIGRRMLDVLSLPIGWLVLMCVVLVIGAAAALPGRELEGREVGIAIGWVVLTGVGWVMLLVAIDRRAVVGGGVTAAMLMHAVFLGYLIGPALTALSLLLVGVSIIEGPIPFGVPRVIAGLPAASTIAWTCHLVIAAAIWWGTVRLHRCILIRCVTSALVARQDEPA